VSTPPTRRHLAPPPDALHAACRHRQRDVSKDGALLQRADTQPALRFSLPCKQAPQFSSRLFRTLTRAVACSRSRRRTTEVFGAEICSPRRPSVPYARGSWLRCRRAHGACTAGSPAAPWGARNALRRSVVTGLTRPFLLYAATWKLGAPLMHVHWPPVRRLLRAGAAHTCAAPRAQAGTRTVCWC
jgi:hypothetical protein